MSEATAIAEAYPAEPPSKLKKIFRFVAWSTFAIVCLVFFTALKIPQPKIHNYVMGTLNQQLNPGGIQISAEEGRLRLGLGVSYEMTGVKLTKTLNNKVLKISRVEVSPALLALAQGKLGANFVLEEGPGLVEGAAFIKGEEFEFAMTTPGVNLGRLGVLPFLANIEGTAEIKGDIQLKGSPKSASSMTGTIKLNLSKITLDQQTLMGMNIPRIAVSDGVADLTLGSGKATINSLRLGKTGGSDDIVITTTGDAKLGRTIDGSEVNLRMKLGLSPTVLKAFVFIDTLLGAAKTGEGTYSLKFVGPIMGAMPMPDK